MKQESTVASPLWRAGASRPAQPAAVRSTRGREPGRSYVPSAARSAGRSPSCSADRMSACGVAWPRRRSGRGAGGRSAVRRWLVGDGLPVDVGSLAAPECSGAISSPLGLAAGALANAGQRRRCSM